ncbi:MAG: ASCH domain-containing protein [Colwellia sp.]|nr:ASCH domain-containing protein [Colwellia sp.]
MKILHLTLEIKWFDMIASGEKKEEYREIKPYWTTRLINKTFDVVLFRNGYSKNAPSILVEMNGCEVGRGNPKWGAPNKNVYIIHLGKIIK